MRFHKMHGLGNDFVVFDAREDAVAIDAAAARRIADRRTGIGCDQLIVLRPSTSADVAMRIWNADGSEAGACGNATRCVPLLIGRDCRIETAAGILSARIEGDGAIVDMGTPRFAWDAIPLAYAMDTAALPVAWEMLSGPAALNVGNPHLVFFVDDVAAVALETLGPVIESDALFPERINVNIAQVLDDTHLRVRTWERGAGLTRACGTGACAAAVTAIRSGRADAPVTVALPGGSLVIDWMPGGTVSMAGPAAHVFSGEIDLPVAA